LLRAAGSAGKIRRHTQSFRVLAPDGSFLLNIGGSYNEGLPTRSLFHFQLLLALVEEVGFHLAQECFWYNPAKMPMPAEWMESRGGPGTVPTRYTTQKRGTTTPAGQGTGAPADKSPLETAMSTAFREFLQQQAKRHQAEVAAGQATVDEWRAAVERLFAQIREWLRASDPEGLIEIKEGQEDVKERGLGPYRVPRLDLRAFGKWIGIIPKARRTVGTATPPQKSAPERAEGRVDMTDELRRYVLYRFRENGRDVWLIDGLARGGVVPDKTWPGDVQYVPRSEPIPLDQEAFERALMSYLQ
jgi:hypothetical protein